MAKNYIGSQEHFEDKVNAHYDALEKNNKHFNNQKEPEQEDNRQQCYKTGLECKYDCSGLCKDS